MKVNDDLIIEASKIADEKGIMAIQYMIIQYQKAIDFKRIELANMMELAIRKFICNNK